ncbi:UxaA family hydrolase [Gracilibacillus sp. D59]|uniref:UxaA family hydrolase n=1 Tax=Gracilibacillus sp. D59 TaxID=3457434 RepID=UPI003FCDBF30
MKHKFLIHHKGDHVGVATEEMKSGEEVMGVYMDDDTSVVIKANDNIPLGHKIALADLQEREPVIEYKTQIGITTEVWHVGDYVHTHNIKTARW